AEDGIRDFHVTGVQTCALPICYNHWVAGNDNHYFANADECAQSLDSLLENTALLEQMRVKNRQRHLDCFTWEHILAQYEQVLSRSEERRVGKEWRSRGSPCT